MPLASPNPRPASAEVHPDDADPHAHQAGPEADHVGGLGAARQPVDQHGGRPRGSHPGGVDSSTTSRSPSARAISWAVEARPCRGVGQYLPAIVCAWPPRSHGWGSNGGRSPARAVISVFLCSTGPILMAHHQKTCDRTPLRCSALRAGRTDVPVSIVSAVSSVVDWQREDRYPSGRVRRRPCPRVPLTPGRRAPRIPSPGSRR